MNSFALLESRPFRDSRPPHPQLITRQIYFWLVLLMPISFMLKIAFNLHHFHWVDPALILSVIAWITLGLPFRPYGFAVFLLLGIFSGILGGVMYPPMHTYDIFREPGRLFMNLTLFWISVILFRRNAKYVVNLFAVSVLLQFGLGIWLWLISFGVINVNSPIESYERKYRFKQTIWIHGIAIPRMGGTFFESPPFGLFMLCGLVIFALSFWFGINRSLLVKFAGLAAFLGLVFSTSSQDLLGFCAIAFLLPFHFLRRRRGLSSLFSMVLAASVIVALSSTLIYKLSQLTTNRDFVKGESGGERFFHLRYVFHILYIHPWAIPFGIGPGRYGDYVAQTGIFARTTVPGVTFVAILAGYGVLGLIAFVWLFLRLGRAARRNFGYFGMVSLIGIFLADSFQANWKWEVFFFTLAFLYAVQPPQLLQPSRNETASA